MLEIKTKFGILKIEHEDKDKYTLFDSEDRILFSKCYISDIFDMLERLNKSDSVEDWLMTFDDCCWGDGTLQGCLQYAREYQEENDRVFDLTWAMENYNRIGDTYFLFEYSEAYHDYHTLAYAIDKDLQDLAKHEELSKRIAEFVIKRDWEYNIAQIGAIIDEFYGKSWGLGIAQDINVLFKERANK